MEKMSEEKKFGQQESGRVSGGEAEDSDARETDVRSYVDNYRTRKVSKAQIEKGLREEFGFRSDEAREKVEKYWPGEK